MSKILEKIVEPSKVEVSSNFLLKIRVERIKSYKLATQTEECIVLESGESLITEGDYYEEGN